MSQSSTSSTSSFADRLLLSQERMARALARIESAVQQEAANRSISQEKLRDEIFTLRTQYQALTEIAKTVTQRLEHTIGRMHQLREAASVNNNQKPKNKIYPTSGAA